MAIWVSNHEEIIIQWIPQIMQLSLNGLADLKTRVLVSRTLLEQPYSRLQSCIFAEDGNELVVASVVFSFSFVPNFFSPLQGLFQPFFYLLLDH